MEKLRKHTQNDIYKTEAMENNWSISTFSQHKKGWIRMPSMSFCVAEVLSEGDKEDGIRKY